MRRLSSVRPFLIAGYLLAYVVLDWVSYIHPVESYAITPWNPPPGLSLALLLIFGLRYAPALFVAALLAEVVVRGGGNSLLEITAYAVILSGGYAAMAAFLLRVARFDPRLQTLRDLVVFGATSAVATMGIAICYVAAHVFAGAFTWEQFPEYVLHDWVGEVIGIMILTPALLVHGPALATVRRWRVGGEAVLQALSIGVALWVVFATGATDPSKLFYVLFLPLIWISMRHGFEGATLALITTQIGLIVSVQLAGYGARLVVEFQLLMLALAVTGGILGMAVGQWRRTQDALRAREVELSTVVSTAPDAILTVDGTGRIMAANAAADVLFQAPTSGLVGCSATALIPDLQGPIESTQGREVRARRCDGSSFSAEVSFGGAAIGERQFHIGIVRDTSRRKEIEEKLRDRERELDRAMRVAAAAEMASVLAHELNQPLTAAANYARACDLMLKRGADDRDRLTEIMGRVVAEVSRAGEVVGRLRDLSRGGSAKLACVEVGPLIDASAQTLSERLQRHEIAFFTKIAPGLPPILVDRVQIEMVLHNLIANAIDAIAGAKHGDRTISVAAAAEEPGFVRVTVRDSGPGLSPAITERLFVPFTTTKPTGSGLGLSISRSIVHSHGGRLWMEPLARGVVVSLTLPTTFALEPMR